MKLNIQLPSPIEKITGSFLFEGPIADATKFTDNILVQVKRDDLIHPVISGNKWRKLKSPLHLIRQGRCKHVISFGGAYSNHLHALGYACAALNVRFTAVIRGDYRNRPTPTLQDLTAWGSKLRYVSKIEYKRRTNAYYCQTLLQHLGADCLIPEGGSGAQSMEGVAEILTEIQQQMPNVTHIVVPVASAGTLAGLLASPTLPQVKIVGIAVLKDEEYLESMVRDLLVKSMKTATKEWQILHDYHHGGYAKTSNALTTYISQFNQFYAQDSQNSTLAIEPVYSGKCFYALSALLSEGYFPANSQVVILHTGGLQGARK